jgi:LmbE family N-acetylglucosaminyl deacetylase
MSNQIPKMLVIAPHPDDGILGPGGSMARFTKAGGKVTVLTIAAHMPPMYSEDVFRMSVEETRRAYALIGIEDLVFFDKPALSLAQIPHHELNQSILEVVMRVQPDILLIPYLDRHIDHRVVFESAMVAARPVLEKNINVLAAYETISSTHWNAPKIEPNFTPNWFVDITQFIDMKINMIECCESQIGKIPHPRSPEALRALAMFRGNMAGVPYAEAFNVIRMITAPEILM